MPLSDQGIERHRYLLVPRVSIYLREGDAYLLIRGSASRKRWPGKYNGVGGHLERGEDVLTAATRELEEETGLRASLWLCGTIVVDVGDIGVGLHVFSGDRMGGTLRPSGEGTPEWVPYDRVTALPTVEDVPALLGRIHRMQRGDAPFAARSFYDSEGRLQLVFSS
ncbi:MAG: NUDIX hydrolase [Anaerolineales bacterium]